MARLIDISPPVSEALAVYPGDVPYTRTSSLAIRRGDSIDLSSIRTTVHVGAHADAPSHYAADGPSIDACPLDRYYGPCQVIAVAVAPGGRILPEQVVDPIRVPRVLFRTDTWPDRERFDTTHAALSPALIAWLRERDVVLVGIDTPSVDPWEDQALATHQAAAANDIGILEGIVLTDVTPGLYTLIALPLKLVGADGAPVRAALVAEDA